jgi:hypothetical protein
MNTSKSRMRYLLSFLFSTVTTILLVYHSETVIISRPYQFCKAWHPFIE